MEHVSARTQLGIHIRLMANSTFGCRRNLDRRSCPRVSRTRIFSLTGLSCWLGWVLVTMISFSTAAVIRRRRGRSGCVLILQIGLCGLLLLSQKILRKGPLNLGWESQICQLLRATTHRNETSCSHSVIIRALQSIGTVEATFRTRKWIGSRVRRLRSWRRSYRLLPHGVSSSRRRFVLQREPHIIVFVPFPFDATLFLGCTRPATHGAQSIGTPFAKEDFEKGV
mmetsp:Transcript_14969/g.24209  ORF Transcript_14969/g.24209 Transcript_14969/m.24209 type:complete len:225 (+) Transcript_14969:508-1182(+)